MKKSLLHVCMALFVFTAVSVAHAADNPWSGTWKENLSKSKLTGSTVTISAKGSGYHFNNGNIEYDFACDGKAWPAVANVAYACIPTSDGGFDITETLGGKVTMKQHRSFSSDGKFMTMKQTNFEDDGTTNTEVLVRERKSGATGLVGTWVMAKVAPSEPDVEKYTVSGGMLHAESIHSKNTVDAKLDGTDATPHGPNVAAGATISYKLVSPNKLMYVAKLNGKPRYEGTMTLSGDGKTITDVSWLPGKESEKTNSIYEKQ